MSSIEFSQEATQLPLGLYRHFKGGEYRVIAVAHHSEDLSELVVYESLTGGGVWVRPLSMFLDTKEYEGKEVPRFTYLGA